MKSVLLYTASGDYISVRRPIGFNRSIEVSAAAPEEWSANATPGTLVGHPAEWWGYDAGKPWGSKR